VFIDFSLQENEAPIQIQSRSCILEKKILFGKAQEIVSGKTGNRFWEGRK
jgi:hypothetical protein